MPAEALDQAPGGVPRLEARASMYCRRQITLRLAKLSESGDAVIVPDYLFTWSFFRNSALLVAALTACSTVQERGRPHRPRGVPAPPPLHSD